MIRVPVTRRRFFVSSGAGFAVFLAPGCSNLIGPPPARPIYLLEPSLPAAQPDAPVAWQLAVAVPLAQASLDTMRIALRKTPSMLDYYAEAAWSDRLPLMIQALIVESFERSGRVPGVARDNSGIAANYRLDSELREFEARYYRPDAAPRVIVRFEAKLAALPARNIIASLTVVEDAQAERNDLESIVAAFNNATGAALQRVTAWTLESLPRS